MLNKKEAREKKKEILRQPKRTAGFLKKLAARYGARPCQVYNALGWSKQRYHEHINNLSELSASDFLALTEVFEISFDKLVTLLKDYERNKL